VAERVRRAALHHCTVARPPQAGLDALHWIAVVGDGPAVEGLPQGVRKPDGGTVLLAHLFALGRVEVDEAVLEIDLPRMQLKDGLWPGAGA
jgi:hypothetical protein